MNRSISKLIFVSLFLSIFCLLNSRTIATSAPITLIDTDEQLTREIASNPQMIVEFYADWCHVCQSIQKPFELVARDPAFKSIRFVQVDMEKHPTLSKKYNVLGFPTFIYFKKGKNIKQDMGVHNIADFKNELSTTIRKQFRLAENTAHKS